MNASLAGEVSVSANGKSANFVVHILGVNVPCLITRRALEEHFWLPAGANNTRLRKAINDGHDRISAAVERKMLRARDGLIRLDYADSSHQHVLGHSRER
jgi:hypothetical protein